MIWFTADLHFGHERIIEYEARPFEHIGAMDKHFMEVWNRTVAPGDTVFVLGDFSFHHPDLTTYILKQLAGNKVLIKGNHDHKKTLKKIHGWAFVKEYHELKHRNQRVVLCHYPFETWRDHQHGSWHLHGHSHGSLKDRGRRMDVGVDAIGLNRVLISFEELNGILSVREPYLSDYHGREEGKWANVQS